MNIQKNDEGGLLKMVRNFLKKMHTLFPQGAVETLIKAADRLEEAGMLEKLGVLEEPLTYETRPIESLLAEMDEMAKQVGLFPNTVYLLLYLSCAERLKEKYRELGFSKEIFDGFIRNIVSCMHECYSLHRTWGVLHGTWHQGFLILKRFAIGSFVFDIKTYPYEAYTKDGITVEKDSRVYYLHIPTGASLKKEERLKSYKMAYSFFSEKTTGKYMCFVCNSWLLYPEHRKLLPQKSNIRDFMNDFEIIRQTDRDYFRDAWRVFGASHTESMEKWPAETSFQRAYLNWLQQGGKTGDGFGIMLFDGEQIL